MHGDDLFNYQQVSKFIALVSVRINLHFRKSLLAKGQHLGKMIYGAWKMAAKNWQDYSISCTIQHHSVLKDTG